MGRLTPQQALERAMEYKNTHSGEVSGMRKVKALTSTSSPEIVGPINFDVNGNEETANMYLNKLGNGGFITSAYDDAEPILGEWEHSGNDVPPNLSDWLQANDRELNWLNENSTTESVQEGNENVEEPVVAENSRTSVYPLLDINGENKFHQHAPFNDYLGNNIVGCPGTSIAQIIYYWGVIRGYKYIGCKNIEEYTDENNKVRSKFDPISYFDFTNLVPSYTSLSSDIAKSACANLCAYTSRACRTTYGTTLSYAYSNDIYKALKYKFNLIENTRALCLNRTKLYSWAISDYFEAVSSIEGEQKIYDELKADRPILICGSDANGMHSHIFVCDGYDKDKDMYHFNFGWGGSDWNGFYKLSALKPIKYDKYGEVDKTRDYNNYKIAYIGIAPPKIADINKDGEIDVVDLMSVVEQIGKNFTQGDDISACDVNHNGIIDSADAMWMADYILGKIK